MKAYSCNVIGKKIIQTTFHALFIYIQVGISRSASVTDDRFYLSQ